MSAVDPCHQADADLLAAVLGGRDRRVCESGLSLLDIIQRPEELPLSPAQRRRLLMFCELHRRLVCHPAPNRLTIRTPDAVAALMAPRLATLEIETFWALALDARSRLIGEPIRLSIGDVDGCDAGPRSFIRAVVRRGATSAIAVHNHPTGDPSPSAADIAVTTRLTQACRTVDLTLADHVIIGQGAWVSLRREHGACFAG